MLTIERSQAPSAGRENACVTGVALDVIFPVLHGPYGEDGTIQGLLELANVPYVGAGVLASAVGMDKAVMKVLFAAHGLPVVDHVVARAAEWAAGPDTVVAAIEARLPYPVFVKPTNLGSSVGISKARTRAELTPAIALALQFDRKVIVEAAVPHARDIEVSVVGNDSPETSVPGEILAAREFYDYEAKYLDQGSSLRIPAPLTDAQDGADHGDGRRGLPGHRRGGVRAGGLLRQRRRRHGDRERDQHHPGFHDDQRVPEDVGSHRIVLPGAARSAGRTRARTACGQAATPDERDMNPGWRRRGLVALLGAVVAGVAVSGGQAPRHLTGSDLLYRAYTSILDVDFDRATRETAEACGPAPKEACQLLALTAERWHVELDLDSRERDAQLLAGIEKAIQAAEAWTKREPARAEAWFYLGVAYGLRAQMHGLRLERLAAARDGKKIKNALERALALDPGLADAHFGIGLYKYVAGVVPAPVKLLLWLLMLPGGDREAGMQSMLAARDGGELLARRSRLPDALVLPLVRGAAGEGARAARGAARPASPQSDLHVEDRRGAGRLLPRSRGQPGHVPDAGRSGRTRRRGCRRTSRPRAGASGWPSSWTRCTKATGPSSCSRR